MGAILKWCDLNNRLDEISKPLIYCSYDKETYDLAISVNRNLALELSKHRVSVRAIHMERCFNKVISELENNAIIKDFDVLFNPSYEIDVIKLFISAYRKKAFRVIWSGKFIDGKLQYSEDGFADYKTFDIGAYDITCII